MRNLLRVWAFVGTQFIVSAPAIAQPNTWAKAYGGGNGEVAWSVKQTHDNGYILAGWTQSYGAGNEDFLVLKLNSDGNVDWAKTFGGGHNDWAQSVQQTSDSGYIVAGFTHSYSAGIYDFLVIRLNSVGDTVWAKTFGDTLDDRAYSVQQTYDNGYIVAGGTNSYGAGKGDCLVIKLNSAGNVDWAKTYGDTMCDGAKSIQQTSDSGYIVAGGTESYGAGKGDCLVIKLNSAGNVDWAKTYGGTDSEGAQSVQQTSDSGYILAGMTQSYGAGGTDFLVIRLNSVGDTVWARTFGGWDEDRTWSVQQTFDSGYIVAGGTESYGAGYYDFLVIKLNSSGNAEWAKTYGGGSDVDLALSVQQASDSGYIVAGYTFPASVGDDDFYVVKTDANGIVPDTIGVCEGFACSPATSSPTVTITSPSPAISSPSVGVVCSPEVSSPAIPMTTICEPSLGIEEREKLRVESLELRVFPNPFATVVRVQWLGVNEGQKISLKVYDLGGRLVKTLLNNEVKSENKIEANLEELTKGIYFVKIEVDSFIATKKIILMR